LSDAIEAFELAERQEKEVEEEYEAEGIPEQRREKVAKRNLIESLGSDLFQKATRAG